MTRKYSSISVETTLASSISNSATSMTVATGTAAGLLGGVSLAAGNVDTFAVAVDPDTSNEEIIFITANSGDSFSITRGQAGTTAVAHSNGATIQHVLSSADLTAFEATTESAVTLNGTQTITNKTINPANNTLVGVVTTNGTQTLTNKTISASSNTLQGIVTPTGATTLTNKKLTTPKETITISATAATGTINYDAVTQSVLYYTTNASGNWTLNIRGDSSTTFDSLTSVGDAVTLVFMATNGSTAYYATSFTIDGSTVTPKWVGGSAPSSGNTSSIDAYTYTIVKTNTATFTVLASRAKYA